MAFVQTALELNSADQTAHFQLFLVSMLVYSLVYAWTSFMPAGVRYRVFSAEFMEQFDQEHMEAFGTKAPKGGHPDDGNGYYSQKLSYKDWYEFQNVQRAHYNFLETIIPVAIMTSITAINQPLWAAICGFILAFARILYAQGYKRFGPKGRVAGAVITDLALLAVLVGAFITIFTWDTTNTRVLPFNSSYYPTATA